MFVYFHKEKGALMQPGEWSKAGRGGRDRHFMSPPSLSAVIALDAYAVLFGGNPSDPPLLNGCHFLRQWPFYPSSKETGKRDDLVA